jgi:hypothetical protein
MWMGDNEKTVLRGVKKFTFGMSGVSRGWLGPRDARVHWRAPKPSHVTPTVVGGNQNTKTHSTASNAMHRRV